MIAITLWRAGHLVAGVEVAVQAQVPYAALQLIDRFPQHLVDGAHIDITDQESADAKAALKKYEI